MKARYLFILAVLFALVSIVGLRFNNQKAAADARQIRDKDTLSVDVTSDIERLQQFVVKHMNSSVRVELNASYERAVAQAKNASSSNVSGDVYAQAQAACDQQGVGSVAQAQCVQDYLSTRIQPGQTAAVVLPAKSRFIYAFAAPNWTPDIAGFSLLAALVFAISSLVVYVLAQFKRPDNPNNLVAT